MFNGVYMRLMLWNIKFHWTFLNFIHKMEKKFWIYFLKKMLQRLFWTHIVILLW
jgi:hypothetical protein